MIKFSVDLVVRQATTCNNFKDDYTDRPKNEDVPRQKLVCLCLFFSFSESQVRHQNGNHSDFLGSISIKISGPNSVLELMELSSFLFSFVDF